MRLILFAILTISISCSADEIRIFENEMLFYVAPVGFDLKISNDPGSRFKPVLDFAHFNEQGFKDFGYKIFLNKVAPSILTTDKEKEDLLRYDCEEHRTSSVEQAVIIKKIKGDNDVFMCSFTDKNIPADVTVPRGQFRHISIAFIKEGHFAYTTVVYSNELGSEFFDDLFTTLHSLKVREF